MSYKLESVSRTFRNREIIWAADLVAVKMNNGTYNIFKSHPSMPKGTVDGLAFMGILIKSKRPLVLNEDSLDKDIHGQVVFM
ncbi:hypothetical protein ABWK22_02820 [Gottfriedia acidiceleris]|uniref:hypothetical protein n=1 Tax=Gottfriedia acidiceleris TaxID=371036 RepID=UPI003399DEB1